MTAHRTPQRRRGRPPKKEVEYLRAIAWYQAVTTRTGTTKTRALEKLFPIDKKHQQQIAEGMPRGSWRIYRSGRLPRANLTNIVEQRYPMTRMWLELPIWELLETPGPNIKRLYQIRKMLRPDVSDLLIEGEALGSYLSALFRLFDKADVEAMAGCLLIRRLTDHQLEEVEDKYLKVVNRGATSIALHILMFLAVVERPFAAIHPRLFNYMSTQLYPGSQAGSEQPNRRTVACLRSIALILQEATLLRSDPAEWRAFLNASKMLYTRPSSQLKDLYDALLSLYRQDQLNEAGALPTVKKLIRAMKKAPRTKSCLDDCLVSFATS